MKLKCEGCGGFHVVSPTAMLIIIDAFQLGELQRVTGQGIVSLCVGNALTPETVTKARKKDSNTVVAFDEQRWDGKKQLAA